MKLANICLGIVFETKENHVNVHSNDPLDQNKKNSYKRTGNILIYTMIILRIYVKSLLHIHEISKLNISHSHCITYQIKE